MPNVMLKLLDDEFLIAHDARRGRRSIRCRTLLAFGLHTDTTCLSVACRLSVLLSLSRSALHGNRICTAADDSFWPDSAGLGVAASRPLSGVHRAWCRWSLEGSP